LATHYSCGKVVLEELNIKVKNHKKGKIFNRLVNNIWNRQDLIGNLKKRCDLNDIEFVMVNPAYSSIVGNINYGNNTTPDMVASSIELARRGYKKYSKSWFYPVLKNIDNLKTLWKEALDWSSMNWKDIFTLIKSKPEMRYRFLLNECSSSLSYFNYRSSICTFLYK
jgi:IS605 OrfB family transposase